MIVSGSLSIPRWQNHRIFFLLPIINVNFLTKVSLYIIEEEIFWNKYILCLAQWRHPIGISAFAIVLSFRVNTNQSSETVQI